VFVIESRFVSFLGLKTCQVPNAPRIDKGNGVRGVVMYSYVVKSGDSKGNTLVV
jgi:hypothetical protein